jgi:rubrerythrin
MSLKKAISSDIREEAGAAPNYRKLASRLSSAGYKREARTARGIAKQETKHRGKLIKIKRRLK